MQHYLLNALLGAFALTAISHSSAQTAEQISHLSEALNSAWKSNSDKAFSRLYSTEGADQYQVDTTVSQWSAQRAYTPDATMFLKAIHSKAEIEAKANEEPDKRTGTFTRLLKIWTELKTMNGHIYVPNLVPIGYAEIDIIAKEGTSRQYIPLGIDADRNLRFCLMRIKKE
jgi:hypothetical protein